MPGFATVREGLELGKKLSHGELVRALRFSIAAEFEAVQIYEQIAEATNDAGVRAVFEDVIREEKIHAGQFLGALYEVAPEEARRYEEGMAENRDLKQPAGKR